MSFAKAAVVYYELVVMLEGEGHPNPWTETMFGFYADYIMD